MEKIKTYLKLIRVKHYIKNIILFIPMLFANALTKSNIKQATIGFIAFSFMASFIYIINDLKDYKNDINHPTKKNRPIASGKISKTNAMIVAVLMLILSLVINYFLRVKTLSYSLLIIYLCFNLFYSFGLKKKPIVDILLLVSFYILRIYYGGVIVGVKISDLLFLTITFASLYLTFGKRRNEFMKSKDTRDVLKYYNKDFLDKFMYVCLALTIIFYSLWTIEQNIKYLSFSVIIVLAIFLKYSLIIESDSDGDPTDIIFKDKAIILLGVIYLAFMLYFMR